MAVHDAEHELGSWIASLMRTALRAAWAAWLCLTLILVCMASPVEASSDVSPRLAKGLIVKLRRPGQRADATTSVVRLQAAAAPVETRQEARMRMVAVARRHGVSYLVHRPTAFAAQLIHSGRLEPIEKVQADAERLRADPEVEWAIANEVVHTAGVVSQTFNDPAYAQQTWLHERETTLGGLQGVANIAAAWDAMLGQRLSPVVVAVLDTGILYAPDLDGRIAQGYDFVSEIAYSGDGDGVDSDPTDPGISLDKIIPASLQAGCSQPPLQWHGLRIASMLGAQAGNALDGVGILAPVAGPVVLPVRVVGMCGAELSDIIEGMLWAAGVDYQGSPPRNLQPARVVNISLGGDGSCSDTGTHDAAWLYRDTIQTLESRGALVVASAGNGSPDNWLGLASPTRPASCPGVLAVTALNQQGYKANYANLVNGTQQSGVAVAGGDMVMTVGADGKQVFTRLDDGILALADKDDDGVAPLYDYEMQAGVGTSFSAPTAAGVAALMLALDPSLTVAELRKALVTQVAPFPTVFPDTSLPVCQPGVNGQGNCICTLQTCGAGVLDALRAVNWAMAHAASAATTPGAAMVATSSCFKPDRLGGGSSCDSGGGGGGAIDALSLLALLAACLASVWMTRGARELPAASGMAGAETLALRQLHAGQGYLHIDRGTRDFQNLHVHTGAHIDDACSADAPIAQVVEAGLRVFQFGVVAQRDALSQIGRHVHLFKIQPLDAAQFGLFALQHVGIGIRAHIGQPQPLDGHGAAVPAASRQGRAHAGLHAGVFGSAEGAGLHALDILVVAG